MARNTFLLAIVALVVGNFFATLVDVLVKLLAADVSVYQYIFLRQAAVFVLLFPFWRRLSRDRRQPGKIKVHLFRAVLTNIGGPSAVIALTLLPLATANVVFYAAPLLALIIASTLFNEVLKSHRLIVTLLGFFGVTIALRPEYFGLGSLMALVTAFAVAFYNLSVKWLPADSPPLNTVFWSNLFTLPICGLLAAFHWQTIDTEILLLAGGSCVCLVIYQGCCAFAFQRAQAGAISVAEYSGLVFAALLGWLWFAETLDIWTLFGICLIIFPILWQTWYESRDILVVPAHPH